MDEPKAPLFRSDLQGLTVAQLSELSWEYQGDTHAQGLIAQAVEGKGVDPYA